MHRLRVWLSNYWELNSLSLLGLASLFIFLWYRLRSLTPGFSSQELIVHTQLISKTYTPLYLWHHILSAPYTIGLIFLQFLHVYGATSIRSIGAGFGFLTVVLFFYLTWRWYGTLVALLSTVIFSDNLWFLLSTRNGGEVSIYGPAIMLMIACGLIIRRNQNRNLNIFGVLFITALLAYVPGMIWFLLIGGFVQRKYILEELRSLSGKYQLLLFITVLVIVSPLLYSVYAEPSLAKQLIGLPAMPIKLHQILLNLAHYPLGLFINGSYEKTGSIGHLPMLDIFSDMMLVLGIAWSFFVRKLDRTKLLALGILLGWLLSSLGGSVPSFVTMPFIYMLIAAGIAYLLSQWFSVFPRNPLARGIGIGLICLAVTAVAFYHFDQYFVAWPHTASTILTYSHHY